MTRTDTRAGVDLTLGVHTDGGNARQRLQGGMRLDLGRVSTRRVSAASDERTVGSTPLYESPVATIRTHDFVLVAANRKPRAPQKWVVRSVALYQRSVPARWTHDDGAAAG